MDIKAVNTALLNVKAAGLSSDITIKQQDFKDFTQPTEKSIIITNPPYGERISTPDLLGTYKMIGERLKHQFKGNDAWVLSYREECFDQIGIVKTEEEKRQMAEKHRFKKNREFKQRLEETEQNEEADIRSFTFHKHELNKNRGGHESFDRSGKDRKDRKEFSRDKNRKDFKRGGKREFGKKGFDRKKKGFDRKKRFDDDED